MNRIAAPKAYKHVDPFLECKDAMAGAFSDVAMAAVKAGWNPEEVSAAIVELAAHMMLGLVMNHDVDRDLSNLRRR